MDLRRIFEEINRAHFDSFLDPPELVWNSRLRSSAGRFFPGSRRFFSKRPPKIEVASYLKGEVESDRLIRDTLGHEMIHYWLWVHRKPYGHTEEFQIKMRQMGVSRYNPVPQLRPPKHHYRCPSCDSRFPARRKLGVLACAQCCRRHSGGRFDPRFQLVRL